MTTPTHPVRLGVRTDVLADIAGPRHFDGGGAGKLDRLGTDLVRLSVTRAKWAHGQ